MVHESIHSSFSVRYGVLHDTRLVSSSTIQDFLGIDLMGPLLESHFFYYTVNQKTDKIIL